MTSSVASLRIAQPLRAPASNQKQQPRTPCTANISGKTGIQLNASLFTRASQKKQLRCQRLVVRANEESVVETEQERISREKLEKFESKLDNRVKGFKEKKKAAAAAPVAPSKGFGDGKQKAKQAKSQTKVASAASAAPAAPAAPMDFSDEVTYYEGKPATGDLAVNIALGATLLWLPLTLASVGRYIYLKYKFTDKRFMIESTSPVLNENTECTYDQVAKVVSVGRGVGLWGDLVITLTDGSKVEFRSLEKFKEIQAYVEERMPVSEDVDPDSF